MKNFILIAALGMVFATLPPERGAATPLPHVSAGPASLVVQVGNRCTRLLRRCSRGNNKACVNYRIECRLLRPIY